MAEDLSLLNCCQILISNWSLAIAQKTQILSKKP